MESKHTDRSKSARCGNYHHTTAQMHHTDVEGLGLLKYFNLWLEGHAICPCRFFIALNISSINGRINNTGAKVPQGESSLEHSFPGAKVPGSKRPGNESSRERKFPGAKVP